MKFSYQHILSLLLLILTLLLNSTASFAGEQPSNDTSCGNNPQAAALIRLIKNHPQQQRQNLHCHPLLNDIALRKAQLMIESQDIWHNAGHMTPNQLLRHHGFKLPLTYPLFGNQVEALAGGNDEVEEVFTEFLNSEPHRMLLLGEDPFFAAQDQLGAAYVHQPGTDHLHHWVVIIADERNQSIIQQPVVEVEPPVINTKKRKRGREIKEKMYRRKVRNASWQ